MTVPEASARADRQARALRQWRDARIAAGPALRRRAQRRRRQLTMALRAVATLIVLAVLVAGGFAVAAQRDDAARTRGEHAQAAARSALQTMLTADPGNANGYVDAVLAVSTGEQRQRIETARAGLVAEISRQSGPSTGRVVSTSLVDEPTSSGEVTVLVVAEATNAALIGAMTTDKRIPVLVTLTLLDGAWLVAKARQA